MLLRGGGGSSLHGNLSCCKQVMLTVIINMYRKSRTPLCRHRAAPGVYIYMSLVKAFHCISFLFL